MGRLFAILLSAVIAAAFLGPGTITTAARAGAAYGPALLWTLAFSTVACLALQEASARLTIVSGLTLGQALRQRFAGGLGALLVTLLVLGAVVLGCAAYQAGNILGGVAGAELALGWPRSALTVLTATAAGALLWRGSTRLVVTTLSALVAVMGIAFLLTALPLLPPPAELLAGLLVPRVPPGSLLLVLGLVGTTVVPYNLFLGSGLARGQDLGETRLGLLVAIGLGGLISMAVVIAGSAVGGTFDYPSLAAVLAARLGDWARLFFAAGLFAAGFSSAVTAPLAAAVTVRSLFAGDDRAQRWHERSWRYRAVWLGVLATGTAFGLSGVKPIPAIIAAQATNGLLLPVVAFFLLLMANDRRLLGRRVNGPLANALMALVVAVTVLLGLLALARAAAAVLGTPLDAGRVLLVALLLIAATAFPVTAALRRARRG